MARGIKLPTKAVKGRLQMISGDAYIDQLIMTALGPSESENPFQDLGLGEAMVFAVNDELSQGEIRTKVELAFERFEADQLARLEKLTFQHKDADMLMLVEYINLETGGRVELEVPIPADV